MAPTAAGAGACVRLLALTQALAPAAALLAGRASRRAGQLDPEYSFEKFVGDYNKPYKQGTEEWEAREALFQQSLQRVLEFNALPGRTWSMGITEFMDHTEAEFKAMLGYRGSGTRSSVAGVDLHQLRRGRHGLSFAEEEGEQEEEEPPAPAAAQAPTERPPSQDLQNASGLKRPGGLWGSSGPQRAAGNQTSGLWSASGLQGAAGNRMSGLHGAAAGARKRRTKPDRPPKSIDVLAGKPLGQVVRSQGRCGSCWALAAVGAIEGHLQNNPKAMAYMHKAQKTVTAYHELPTLSSQTILSCTENPRHCGGLGGCQGATPALAFELVQRRGLPLAAEWSYVAEYGAVPACAEEVFARDKVLIKGYSTLPSNGFWALKQGLVMSGGPVVVSVDASNWAFYTSGVYSDVPAGLASNWTAESNGTFNDSTLNATGGVAGNATGDAADNATANATANATERVGRVGDFNLNHAALLTGYSDPTPSELGYWTLKNSWGASWGEAGFIRIEMKADEKDHCGWDNNAQEAVACEGEPSRAWVCGTCGILYDAMFPYGVHTSHG